MSHDKITFYIGISFPGHYLDVECQNNRKLEWFYFQNGGPQHTETLPRHLGDLLSFRGRTVIALACYSVFWIFMTSHAIPRIHSNDKAFINNYSNIVDYNI